MFVNKIYLYDDKMTVLCNTQDGHFDVDLKEVSSLKDQLVEAGGVEPPSENASSGTSPGADGHLHSLTQAWADTLRGLVASLFMVRSKLCAHTCTTKRRPIPDRGPSGWNGHGLSRDKLNVIVVL